MLAAKRRVMGSFNLFRLGDGRWSMRPPLKRPIRRPLSFSQAIHNLPLKRFMLTAVSHPHSPQTDQANQLLQRRNRPTLQQIQLATSVGTFNINEIAHRLLKGEGKLGHF